jgi:hypothetical protein
MELKIRLIYTQPLPDRRLSSGSCTVSSSWSLGVASYLDKKIKFKTEPTIFSRFEQEKENSFKELQKQSIEYEKKLQDQLEERNQELDSLRASHKRAKTERKAFEKARSALEVPGFSKLVFLSCIGEMSHNYGSFMFFFYFSFSNLSVSLDFLLAKSWQQSLKHLRK